VAELVLTDLCEEIAAVVPDEHDARDVLDQLRIRVGFQPLLADEGADPFDVAGAVAGGHHDVADPSGVKSLQIPAPLQITHAPCGIARARGGPTLDMLSARGDAEMLGCVPCHARERLAPATSVNELRRLRAAVDLPLGA